MRYLHHSIPTFDAQTSMLCSLYVYVFDYEDYDMNGVRDLGATTECAIDCFSNVDLNV